MTKATDNKVVQYGQWVVNHPWIVILITIALVFTAASGMRLAKFTTDYRVFFSEDNPQMLAFEELENMYTKNDNVMFIITPKDGTIFTKPTLEIIHELSEEAWQTPYSIRVDSVSSFQHTEAEGDDLIVRDLVSEDYPLTDAEIAKIKQVALNDPFLVNRLVSKSGHVTGVNVTIQLPAGNAVTAVPEVVQFSRELKDRYLEKYPDIEIRLSGMVMMNNAFSEASQQDMQTLVAFSFVLMLVTLAFMLKNVSGTVATLFVIVFSIFVGLGLGMYAGYPITPPSATTPNIVLTVAIANSVHILVTFLMQMRSGNSKKESMVESLRINVQPVFLASITTAIGFLTMNFSDVPPFQHLGNMVAIGVLASFVLAVFFLPAVITLLPIRVKQQENSTGQAMMKRLGAFVVNNKRALMWSNLIAIVALISFLPRNELNDVFVKYFDESIEFRRDADYFTENLSGLYQIDYSLDSGEPGGINNPGYLKDVERFAEWFEQQPETLHVNTFTDIMRRLNKNMHGDDQSWYRQPEDRDLAAQYLLLYEMSLRYGLDLNNQINIDKSATRFTVSLKTVSSNQLIEIEERAQAWLDANATHIVKPHGSGTSLMFAHIGKINIKSMLTGTTLALILISLILIVALKSFKIGGVSLIPNLVPAAMGFGLWGIFVGEIGLSLSIVAGMTLGIVVDDTVHFLSKYLRARREENLNPNDAVRYAFSNVGMALLTTSVVLVIGFLVLSTSAFELNAGMGMLTAIVISFALLADFFFLPPLLIKLEEKKNEQMAPAADDSDAVIKPSSA